MTRYIGRFAVVAAVFDRRLLGFVSRLAFLGLGLGLATTAMARPEYVGLVTQWCADAGRVAPASSKISCNGCHAMRPTVDPLFSSSRPTSSSLLGKYCKAASAGNTAPVVAPIADKNATVGKLLKFKVVAKDNDGDPLTVSADGVPLTIGASFDSTTKTFSWTPAADQVTTPSAPYSVSFTARDNQTPPLSDSVTVNIYVNAAGTAPVPLEASIRRLGVGAAAWKAKTGMLVVKGRVVFTKGQRPDGLTVTVSDDAGTVLGTADVNKKGVWVYRDPNLSASPCGVQASIDAFTAQRKVAHSGCGVRHHDDDDESEGGEHGGDDD
jgi:hypothetical protein